MHTCRLQQVYLHYWTPGPHLSHHAASSPHINRGAVVPLTKQQLWRAIPGVQKLEVTIIRAASIPECYNAVCVAVGLAVLFNGESPCKAEVSQLQYPPLCDQDVGGLHIPMKDLVVVDVVEALEDLLHHLLDLRQGELHTNIAEQAGQIVLAEVKDQVEGCFVSVVGPADLNQIDYVFVVELLKNANLPKNNASHIPGK